MESGEVGGEGGKRKRGGREEGEGERKYIIYIVHVHTE